jgi:hypothetical protein
MYVLDHKNFLWLPEESFKAASKTAAPILGNPDLNNGILS